MDNVRQFLGTQLAPGATVAATLTFVAVRSTLAFVLRARPEGPNVYQVTRRDAPAPWLMRVLTGDAWSVAKTEASVTQVVLVEAARRAVGRAEAQALIWVGWQQRVLISDPADVRYMLIERAEAFEKPAFVTSVLPILGRYSLVTIADEAVHTEQYRHVSHAFSPAAVREIGATTMRAEFAAVTDELKRKVQAAVGGGELRVVIHSDLTRGALSIISEAAFRTRDMTRFQAVLNQMGLRPPLMLLMPSALLKYLPGHRRAMAQREELGQVVDQVMKSQSDSERNDDNSMASKKLIDLLAETKALTREMILDHTVTFVFAGHETTANGLNWLCYLLATNLRAQEALAEELADAFDPGTTPAVATLTSLSYLNAVVLEGLRRFAPVGTFIRCSQTDHILPGSNTYIPAGTPLHVAVHALHHNKAVWGPDVDEFRPERWIEEPGLKERVTPCSFLPFAAGKRACIGKDFAMHELLIGTALLFRNFSMAWPEGQARPFRKTGIVTRPAEPFELLITRRQW